VSQELQPEGNINILLVDDNLVNQEIATSMLKILGHTVDVANNGEQALVALNKKHYHIVLMDCEMPVLDGYATTKAWREMEKELQREPVTIIALTAHALVGEREKCLASGMNDFLAKPFEFEAFREMLNEWLDLEVEIASPIQQDENATTTLTEDNDENVEILDQQKLDQLRNWQGKPNPELLKKVVLLFLEQMPALLEELLQAAQRGDTKTVSGIAHTLKSSSDTVGAMGLMALCQEIELCRETGMIDMALVSRFQQTCKQVDVALNEEINTLD
jgi:CheY-like chemotaxis protein